METKINAVMSRTYGVKQTTSCFYVFDGDMSIFNCKTIELPDFNNAKNISCILPGVYDVIKTTSPTKGYPDGPNKGLCFRLLNVKGRENVLIHIGNFATGSKVDTQGCILPGLRFEDINKDGYTDVADSKKAMNILLTTLPDKFKLTIL